MKLSIFIWTLVIAAEGARIPNVGVSDVLSRQPRWLWPWEAKTTQIELYSRPLTSTESCPEQMVFDHDRWMCVINTNITTIPIEIPTTAEFKILESTTVESMPDVFMAASPDTLVYT